jgi:uncharacterized protein YdaL
LLAWVLYAIPKKMKAWLRCYEVSLVLVCAWVLLIGLEKTGESQPKESKSCVQIFFDRIPTQNDGSPYLFGRTHVMLMQNLLGHFPKWQQVVIPIDTYQQGQVERCEVNFYLGTHYFSPVPESFFSDYLKTKKTVVWLGYQIWKFPAETLMSLWQVKFKGVSTLDLQNKDSRGEPGFYRFYDYLGERFEKFGIWQETDHKKTYMAAFEVSLFERLGVGKNPFELATAIHSVTGATTPYVLRNQNHWYVAESPFALMTEDDRYLIFADLLFDILQEKPLYPGPKPALVRVEDVHPMVPIWKLKAVFEMFKKLSVPFSISVIPHYMDPLGLSANTPQEYDVPITSAKEMVQSLGVAQKNGGTIILHGYTHQYGHHLNPFTAISGEDFEFWDRAKNTPIAEESIAWGLGRLDDALYLLQRASERYSVNLRPYAWLTPHYQCSALMCTMMGLVWNWTIGRNIYFNAKAVNLPAPNPLFQYNNNSMGGQKLRLQQIGQLQVTHAPEEKPAGQFFPYEIYGDVYGQRVLPENLGNIQPFFNEQVNRTRTIDQMIITVKRNRVLRDAWASFFVHPAMVEKKTTAGLGNFSGDTSEIERLVRAILDSGYQFIDLKNWQSPLGGARRPSPKEAQK